MKYISYLLKLPYLCFIKRAVQLEKLCEKYMTTSISAEQARNTSVFVINFKGEVEETTLFDHIMESAEKTTSPRGVEHKLYINEGEDKEGNLVWFLNEWKPGGKSQIIDKFQTEEEADEEKFQRIWKYDFMTDDQRDTQYWNTCEEAQTVVKERLND